MFSRLQIVALVSGLLVIICGLSAATQWVAGTFGAQTALGPPALILGGAPIYPPGPSSIGPLGGTRPIRSPSRWHI